MSYRYLFRPERVSALDPGPNGGRSVYVYDDERVVLAVNVALAAARPLLVYGAAGSGKSSLAANVAGVLGWRYLEHVITSRTEPQDLLWSFDAVRRLSHAQSGHEVDSAQYDDPGVLWQAFEESPAVVLLDEIDKADPDLPNGLLEPLGSFSFRGPGGERVAAPAGGEPLVVITTNDERDLPRPFLRRCVVLTLREPDRDHLKAVANTHLEGDVDPELVDAVVDSLESVRARAAARNEIGPSTAEFLDALRACRELGITSRSPEWSDVVGATLTKTRDGGR